MTKSGFAASLVKTIVAGSVFVACAGPGEPAGGGTNETEATGQAIVNGTVATSNPYGIVDLWMYAGAYSQCTGTLLNSRWVLTANHCRLAADGQSLLPGSYFTASNTLTVNDSSPYVYGDAIFSHPNLDVALIHLASALPGTDSVTNVLGLQQAQEWKTKTVTCYGYGGDTHFASSGWAPNDILRFASSQKITDDDGTRKDFGLGSGIWMVLDIGPGNHQAEWEGDSGGPCFYTDANNNRYLVMVFTNFIWYGAYWNPINSAGPSAIGFRDWVWQTMMGAPVPLGGQSAYGPGIAAPNQNNLQVFYTGGTYIYEDRWNGSNWTGLASTNSPFASGVAAARRDNSNSFVVTRRSDNNFYWAIAKMSDGTVGTWKSMNKVLTGTPAAVSTQDGSNYYTYVFGRGTDNKLYWSRYNGSGSPSAWTAVSGGTIASDPTAASPAAGSVYVFTLTSNGAIQYARLSGGSWQWQSPAFPGYFSYVPAVTSSGPNQLDLFVHNAPDHLIYYRKWYGEWAPAWTYLGLMTDMTAIPGVTSRAPGRIDLAFMASGQGLSYAKIGY